MFRKLLFLLCIPLVANAAAVHETEYGVAQTFNFELYNTDGTLDVDEVDGGAEVSIACDEGAETTATNDFTDEGTFYSIAVTAAELQCARATVVIAATDTNLFYIETTGHPDAQRPCPAGDCVTFGTAQASTASTIVLASATTISDDFLIGTLVDIVEGTGADQTRFCTDWVSSTDTCTVNEDWDTTPSTDSEYLVRRDRRAFITVDASGRVDVGYVGGTAQTANDMSGDVDVIVVDTGTDIPATITTLQNDSDINTGTLGVVIDDLAIGTGAFTVGAITDAVIATNAIGALEIAADAIGASELAANAIGSAEIATDAIDADALAADASAEIADQVWLETLADHSGSSGSTAEALAAAGAGGDPWLTALPGSYGAGTAGEILGDWKNGERLDIILDVVAASQIVAQNDLDTITGSDGTTLATAQGNYMPAVAGDEMGLTAGSVDLVWDEIIETAGATYTGRCLLAMLGAYAAGTINTVSNTSTYKDTSDTSTRIVGTVTAAGRGTMSITCP